MTHVQSLPSSSPEVREHLVPPVPYGTYRTLCDETSESFRRTGILSEEKYRTAMMDPRTVGVESKEGLVPLFVSLEHVDGYDVSRTRALTGSQEVYLLALPPSLLNGAEIDVTSRFAQLGDAAVLVETPVEHTAVAQELFGEVTPEGWEVKEFIDPRCSTPETQTAAMSIYSARFEAIDKDGHPVPDRHKSIAQAFDEEQFDWFKNKQEPTTFHIQAGILHDHQEIFDQLWELCDNRFEWLGDYHPVSMEETKDFFQQILMDEQTHTLIRFAEIDGELKPVAFGFFVEDLERSDWLNPAICQSISQQAAENDEKLTYFHGIVSNATHMEHYAKEIMTLMARLTQRQGGAHRLVFESTNLSSLYIPRLVQEYSEATGTVKMEGEMKKLAQQDYWYLAKKPTPQ